MLCISRLHAVRRITPWLLGALLAMLAPHHALAQESITSLANGPGNGIYTFASSSPKTLSDLLKGAGDATHSSGHLLLPPGTPRCRPWCWCMARAASTTPS